MNDLGVLDATLRDISAKTETFRTAGCFMAQSARDLAVVCRGSIVVEEEKVNDDDQQYDHTVGNSQGSSTKRTKTVLLEEMKRKDALGPELGPVLAKLASVRNRERKAETLIGTVFVRQRPYIYSRLYIVSSFVVQSHRLSRRSEGSVMLGIVGAPVRQPHSCVAFDSGS